MLARVRAAVAPTLPAVLLVLLPAGCSTVPPSTPTTGDPAPIVVPPRLGGAAPPHRAAPDRPMNRLEQPVAERLTDRIGSQGLTLDYLACPGWDGAVPSTMSCRAWVDGLVVPVRVHVRGVPHGEGVGFDAWLGDGLVATSKLETTLRRQGWARTDCGDAAAYPATVGSRIVCRVEGSGRTRYVVATVSSRSGAVTITDYHGATAGG